MRRLLLLVFLLGSIFLLYVNGYSLNLNDRVDKCSLNPCPFSLATEKRNDHINFSDSNMSTGPFPMIKYHNPFGFVDNFNQSFAPIPMQNIKTRHWFHFTDEVHERLISMAGALTNKNKINNRIAPICNPTLLLSFYNRREFKPVWVSKDGLNNKARVLINTIIGAEHDGLDSETYHQEDILKLVTDIKIGTVSDTLEPEKLAELDLLLTDTFLSYGFHLSEGIVDPYSNNLNWHINKPQRKLEKLFQTVLNDDNMDGFVNAMQPRHPGYLKLKLALLKYQKIKKSGCWNEVPGGEKMQKGDYGTRIAALRSRLIISGDLTASTNTNPN
jgi:murein L,D-transpeptidase YcbB/YkuD